MNKSKLKYYSDKLNKEGFLIFKEYYDHIFCDRAIEEFEKLVVKYPNKVISEKKEGQSGDQRIFGVEKHSSCASVFFNEKFFKDIIDAASKVRFINKFTLAGKVEFDPNTTVNSGGDWHRDSDLLQFKVFLYLTDVKNENGPFMFIPNKQFNPPRRRKNLTLKEIVLEKLRISRLPPRYENQTIMEHINSNQIKKITEKRGTVFICNTSLIHKGDIIRDGIRYSYTNYLYQDNSKVLNHIDKKFKDIIL
jgi:hypothetical protein